MNNDVGAVVYSCDECPFASSNQGGQGAQVMIVPLAENNAQGGQLGGFYNHHHIGNNGGYGVGTLHILGNPNMIVVDRVDGPGKFMACLGG